MLRKGIKQMNIFTFSGNLISSSQLVVTSFKKNDVSLKNEKAFYNETTSRMNNTEIIETFARKINLKILFTLFVFYIIFISYFVKLFRINDGIEIYTILAYIPSVVLFLFMCYRLYLEKSSTKESEKLKGL